MTATDSFVSPPAEDDEDAYVFIDHRDDEPSIVEYVSARLEPEDELQAEEDGDQLLVCHRGRKHLIPLQLSPHDRYIMISSLAELLQERYRFFVLKSSLDSDTHGLLVVPQESASCWPAVPDHLVALDLGHDYFNDIRVPYLNHESSAPRFVSERERVASANDAMGGLVQALFAGKMDADVAAQFAKLSMKDPQGSDAAAGKSEAEVAAEIQQAFNEALASTDLADTRRELDAAMGDLKSLISAPRRPWWKIW